MKKYLKFILLWGLDKLEWEVLGREITTYQVDGGGKWIDHPGPASWKKIVFYYKEKNTGIHKTQSVYSSLKTPFLDKNEGTYETSNN